MVTHRPLIVLSLEGLATSALSCYGSSWNKTPAIDAIASSGCVWDRWIARSDDPVALLQQTTALTAQSWAECWRAGGSVELITDVDSCAGALDRSCFDSIDNVLPADPTERPARDIVDSQLGQLVAAAIERDSQDEPWSVLWLHSGFLTRHWDAPRELFPIDEEDEESSEPSDDAELLHFETDDFEEIDRIPPIFDTLSPPQVRLEDHPHPDLVTSWMRTYGCQVRLLDLMIEVLLGSLRADDPHVVLVGTSGFRLGQGGWIGHRLGPLRSPDIRLPLIVSDAGPLRVPQLTGSDRLPNLLRDLGSQTDPLVNAEQWLATESALDIETQSSRARLAVTTPRWFFVRDADASEHLFLKPDDVEDFNDVGRIREDVVQQLSEENKKTLPVYDPQG